MVLTIVNSFVYIYGRDVKKYREEIKDIVGRYSKIGTKSDKMLLNIDYRVDKEVSSPEEIVEYINEFIVYVDELIERIEDEVGVIIDYHSVSNIVFSGDLSINFLDDPMEVPRNGDVLIDLHKIREELLRKYGDRIMKIDKPITNGNEFPGLVITFYLDPSKRNRKGEIIKRRNRVTIILYSNGHFIWTGVTDELYTDLEKLRFFFNVFEFIVEKSKEKDDEEIDLTSIQL